MMNNSQNRRAAARLMRDTRKLNNYQRHGSRAVKVFIRRARQACWTVGRIVDTLDAGERYFTWSRA
ncbi:hypothetical protein BcepF1.037 [Burkholderia phage BcepF1]|uniref:Uncharacterized protein n=1 Tax=Burkholderia phage BcepF1 TaxID=2886897 RepID=A1YZU1_9CAUD|nr:hypothetical protein BcepF1.037 [Burkholderia phage BcepF1]ABL96768.1 hypothetical protein BcepF1.037 [Burkholderia phage BcepF1]